MNWVYVNFLDESESGHLGVEFMRSWGSKQRPRTRGFRWGKASHLVAFETCLPRVC